MHTCNCKLFQTSLLNLHPKKNKTSNKVGGEDSQLFHAPCRMPCVKLPTIKHLPNSHRNRQETKEIRMRINCGISVQMNK